MIFLTLHISPTCRFRRKKELHFKLWWLSSFEIFQGGFFFFMKKNNFLTTQNADQFEIRAIPGATPWSDFSNITDTINIWKPFDTDDLCIFLVSALQLESDEEPNVKTK